MKTARVRRKRTVNHEASSKGFFSAGSGIQEKQNPFFTNNISPKAEDDVATSLLHRAEDKKEEDKTAVKKKEEEKDAQAPQKKADEKEQEGQKLQSKAADEEKDKGQVKTKADEEKKDAVKMQEAPKDEKKDEKINAKFNDNKPSAEFETSLKRTKGGGSPLPDKLRLEVEEIFKTSFSNIRIHTGKDAENLCNQINAQAFTHQNDIYFNSGKYNPDTSQGKHLLIHELTHVVQQGGDEE